MPRSVAIRPKHGFVNARRVAGAKREDLGVSLDDVEPVCHRGASGHERVAMRAREEAAPERQHGACRGRRGRCGRAQGIERLARRRHLDQLLESARRRLNALVIVALPGEMPSSRSIQLLARHTIASRRAGPMACAVWRIAEASALVEGIHSVYLRTTPTSIPEIGPALLENRGDRGHGGAPPHEARRLRHAHRGPGRRIDHDEVRLVREAVDLVLPERDAPDLAVARAAADRGRREGLRRELRELVAAGTRNGLYGAEAGDRDEVAARRERPPMLPTWVAAPVIGSIRMTRPSVLLVPTSTSSPL